jgi:acetyl esterase/lipase
MARRHLLGLVLVCAIALPLAGRAQQNAAPTFARTEDVIYGRKHGMALTMDVFTPNEHANGAAVVWMVSGGWFSAHAAINPAFVQELLDRGYTVFAVVHGSQPKFTIPECIADVNRAVRYIRYHAKDYQIDPQRIGVTGGSAGGHLSLMLGTAADQGNADSKDPVEQTSSRVQAVACFFPPTDFLNYGKEGESALGTGILKNFKAPFDFTKFDPATRSYVLITDEQKRREIGKQISPAFHVSPDDPPTLIMHGDADQLVPIQQAELIMAAFEKAGVEHKLVVKHGGGHGWPDLLKDMSVMADWFDEHLKAH